MTINNNSVEQINVAIIDLENKIKKVNLESSVNALSNKVNELSKALSATKIGLNSGATYDINISGNASTATHAVSADSASTANSASSANNATNATNDSSGNNIVNTYQRKDDPVENATNATNATNDSAGNNISTTYLKKSELIDLIYPVNSVYISVADVSPQTFLGGTWEKVSSGRVLQGADSSHAGGTTIEAGLPNITGSIWWNNTWKGGGADGAFTQSTTSLGGYSGSGTDEYSKYTLNASRSSSIYGNSSTVQPPAFVVYIWKRTA